MVKVLVALVLLVVVTSFMIVLLELLIRLADKVYKYIQKIKQERAWRDLFKDE